MESPIEDGLVSKMSSATNFHEEEVDRFIKTVLNPVSVFGMFGMLLAVVEVALASLFFAHPGCGECSDPYAFFFALCAAFGFLVFWDVAVYPRSKVFRRDLLNGEVGEFWQWHFDQFKKSK